MGSKCSCYSEIADKNEELIPSINKISSNPENEESIKCTDLARIAENRLSPFQFNTEDTTKDINYPVKSAEG